MTKYMVEDIRVKLASGIYDEGQVFLGLAGKLNKEEFESIVSYSTYKDIRPDLIKRIAEVKIARGIYSKYQEDLQKEVVKAEAAELSGVKYSGFHDKKAILDTILSTSISELSTVNLEELRKF